jgi:Ni,Fe-hydrogenase III small subunit
MSLGVKLKSYVCVFLPVMDICFQCEVECTSVTSYKYQYQRFGRFTTNVVLVI